MPEYFRWQPAPSVPAILVDWSTMAGIEADVAEGFERGGALLGSRDPATGDFLIDGFEPIPILVGNLVAWQERIAALPFIGIYRGQTRPGLMVTPEDCAMVEKLLPRSDGVLLLAKHLPDGESMGSFFRCAGGAILDEAAGPRQFPFRRPVPAKPKVLRKMSAWVPVSAAAAGIGLALFVHYGQNQAGENPLPPTAPAGLRLRAEPDGSNVRIAWDARSPLLDGATGAMLNVADGNTSKALRLTAADLRNGFVDWTVHSPEIVFALSVERPGQDPAAESIRWENPRYPINSYSDTPNPKPSPLAVASAPASDENVPPVPPARLRLAAPAPMAAKSQALGRVKRIVNGITSKASHLWPFHSAKPAPQTQ